MERKLRQVTDNVHGTIYLSRMESEMLATSFFYRLHDIYQSSTVYMTFPSNRTKRYEHCLGTMELSGQIFFSAVNNASTEVRSHVLTCLVNVFKELVVAIGERNRVTKTFYGRDETNKNIMSKFMPKEILSDFGKTKKVIVEGMLQGAVRDIALESQTICFFDQLEKLKKSTGDTVDSADDVLLYAFLYQCSLEAVRIAAMFHDVGHPPFSHILEDVLTKLYSICSNAHDFDKIKAETLRDRLGPFIGTHEPPELILSTPDELDSALHEQIGLKMLKLSFQSVIKLLFDDISDETNFARKVTRSLYYITVLEFTFAILLEKGPLFVTLHRILDGPIDADRLDYAVRDALNTGVDWGRIPYKRVIRSAKLMEPENEKFVIAFHEKVTDELDDLLVTRYKIFSRINFHHRSVKTAQLMQKAVRELAEDYLRTPISKDKENVCGKGSICPEISGLWNALGDALGMEETEGQIAKWNDSWLISVLQNAYIVLSDSAFREDFRDDSQKNRSEEDLLNLKELLEVLLLNRTSYYALLKRQRDAKRLMDGIRERAGLTNELLDKQIKHENDKLLNSTTAKDLREASESLHRIQMLESRTFPIADFEELELYLPFGHCEDIIRHILEQRKTRGDIKDYIVSPNPARAGLGVTKEKKDHIYLYTSENDCYQYNIRSTLDPLLKAHRRSCLWLHVYVKPSKPNGVKELLDSLTVEMESELGKCVKNKFGELFPSSKTGGKGPPGEEAPPQGTSAKAVAASSSTKSVAC